jgi:hypothetical protein
MDINLKQYKDIFGAPNTGVHRHRFLGLASVDLFMTILASGIIAYVFDLSVLIVFITLFILGEFMHLIFGVDTAFL